VLQRVCGVPEAADLAGGVELPDVRLVRSQMARPVCLTVASKSNSATTTAPLASNVFTSKRCT